MHNVITFTVIACVGALAAHYKAEASHYKAEHDRMRGAIDESHYHGKWWAMVAKSNESSRGL